MKRILTILLIAVLMCGLTGCATKTLLDPENPVTLSLWHVYGEQADAPMNRLVAEFNATVGKDAGVVVRVDNVTSTSKIGYQLMDAQANVPGAAPMPDLFSCSTSIAHELGAENLVDWKQHFTQEELAQYVPEFVEDGMLDGRLAVFPVSKSSYALYVNGSQFARFSADTGVTYEQLSTWEGFFDAAESYFEWSGGKTFCAMDYLIRHVELDMLARNEEIAYTEDGWYDTESAALKQSFCRFAYPLVQGHIEVADLYANTQVMTGEVLCGIGSTAAIIYYNDVVTYPDNTTEPTDLHVLPLPRDGRGQEFMPQTGVGLAAYHTTAEKAEAAEVFIRWFTEGQRNLDFVVETGYMPVNNGAFEEIEGYEYPNAGYAYLYDAIRVMRQAYTPVVRPVLDGYYDKVNALYDGLREQQASNAERIARGESAEALVEETWEFFRSIA